MGTFESILEAACHTPLLPILASEDGATVLGKCEYLSPSGSLAGRVLPRLIEEAEQTGRLGPGGTIVVGPDPDGGISAAAAAAAKGYHTIVVVTERTSREKIQLGKAHGAEVIVCPAGLDREDTRSAWSVAERMTREIPGAVMIDPARNPLAADAHYRTTGPEIYDQTEGRITHLVTGMASGATITGCASYLKERKPDLTIVGVDVEGSVLYDYFHHGRVTRAQPFRAEGIGAEVISPLLDLTLVDDVVRVTDREAFLAARRLAREAGILAGGSSGASAQAAWNLAKALSPENLVIAILPDAGARYLSTIYDDEWMRENQYLSERPVRPVGELLGNKPQGFTEVMTLDAQTSVRDALDLMKEWEISQLPVMSEDRIVGSIREDQMIDLLVHEVEMDKLAVEKVMEEPFPVVGENADAREIQHHLAAGHPAVLVRRTDGALGILTKFDLIQQLTT